MSVERVFRSKVTEARWEVTSSGEIAFIYGQDHIGRCLYTLSDLEGLVALGLLTEDTEQANPRTRLNRRKFRL